MSSRSAARSRTWARSAGSRARSSRARGPSRRHVSSRLRAINPRRTGPRKRTKGARPIDAVRATPTRALRPTVLGRISPKTSTASSAPRAVRTSPVPPSPGRSRWANAKKRMLTTRLPRRTETSRARGSASRPSARRPADARSPGSNENSAVSDIENDAEHASSAARTPERHGSASGSMRGNQSSARKPRPNSLVSNTRPRWAETTLWTIASPSPVPFPTSLVV